MACAASVALTHSPGHGHAVQRVDDVGEEDAVPVEEDVEALPERLEERPHEVRRVVHRQGDQQLRKGEGR